MNKDKLEEIRFRNKWCNEHWDDFMNNPYDGECESALRVVHEDRDELLHHIDDMINSPRNIHIKSVKVQDGHFVLEYAEDDYYAYALVVDEMTLKWRKRHKVSPEETIDFPPDKFNNLEEFMQVASSPIFHNRIDMVK